MPEQIKYYFAMENFKAISSLCPKPEEADACFLHSVANFLVDDSRASGEMFYGGFRVQKGLTDPFCLALWKELAEAPIPTNEFDRTYLQIIRRHCAALRKSYPMVWLQKGSWNAAIRPDHGANIESLQFALNPIYNTGDREKEPFFQGAAMLMPANRTYEGRFFFEGKEYRLPLNEPANNAHLHGFLYRQAFRVTEQTPSSVTMEYENHGEIYPFAFRMEVTYRIDEGFVQQYRITALEKMPLTFALHTAFYNPLRFKVPLASCQEKDAHHIPTGRYIPLNDREQQYVSGSSFREKIISGYYRSSGQTVELLFGGDKTFVYEVSENFDHWILFNARGEREFLCIEPQAGAVDGLNNGRCTVLQSGETVVYQTMIKEEK